MPKLYKLVGSKQIETKRQKEPFCCVYLVVSFRQKRQLCVHSCNSSVHAATVCTTISAYVCAHPCVKLRVGGVNVRDGDGDTERESEKKT